jgi:hypothetical protein
LSWRAEPCPPVVVACGERGRAFSEGINIDESAWAATLNACVALIRTWRSFVADKHAGY